MSVRRDGAYVRSQRLLWIAREIAKGFARNRQVIISTFIAQLQMETGLTDKTLLSYIDTISRAKGWFVHDGIIYPERP